MSPHQHNDRSRSASRMTWQGESRKREIEVINPSFFTSCCEAALQHLDLEYIHRRHKYTVVSNSPCAFIHQHRSQYRGCNFSTNLIPHLHISPRPYSYTVACGFVRFSHPGSFASVLLHLLCCVVRRVSSCILYLSPATSVETGMLMILTCRILRDVGSVVKSTSNGS